MAQTNSFSIENDAGLAVRQRINEIVAALHSSNAGATAPTDTRPGMLWFDTGAAVPVLKIRNSTNDAWEEFLDGGSY